MTLAKARIATLRRYIAIGSRRSIRAARVCEEASNYQMKNAVAHESRHRTTDFIRNPQFPQIPQARWKGGISLRQHINRQVRRDIVAS